MASNKLSTFDCLDGRVPIPAFTAERREAAEWIGDGSRVLCRRLLRSSGGAGIVIAETVDQLVEAPLYVKYVKKCKEFRIHVVAGQVIDVQEKRRRRGFGDRVPYILNHTNGYVFCRNNVNLPDGASDLALTAVITLGLDFGAVDIIFNEHYNQCYVLEVNCAPGLEGSTLDSYANAFMGIYNETRALQRAAVVGEAGRRAQDRPDAGVLPANREHLAHHAATSQEGGV